MFIDDKDRYGFLVDVGRNAGVDNPRTYGLDADIEWRQAGEPIGEIGLVKSVKTIGRDGGELNSRPWMKGLLLCFHKIPCADGETRLRSHAVLATDPNTGGDWVLLGLMSEEWDRNKAVADFLVAHELGVEDRNLDARDLADEARRQAAALAASDPSSVLAWSREQPTTLISREWFLRDSGLEGHEEDRPAFIRRWEPALRRICPDIGDATPTTGSLSRKLYDAAVREVLWSACSLPGRGEYLYKRDDRGMADLEEGRVNDLADRIAARGADIVDDRGRLFVLWRQEAVLSGCPPERTELRIGPCLKFPKWDECREPRLADRLGVTRPRGERTPGVKEILAGDRVVSAWCADQRDLVSSDGQDSVEYSPNDDDVLEARRRAFEGRDAADPEARAAR